MKIKIPKIKLEREYKHSIIYITATLLLIALTFFSIKPTITGLAVVLTSSITGNYEFSGGDDYSLTENDNNYFYIGETRNNRELNAYIELLYNIDYLDVASEDITDLNFNITYCHEGSDLDPPSCDGEAAEGTPTGIQHVQIWDYANQEWFDIGQLSTTDFGQEIVSNFSISNNIQNFIDNYNIKIRYGVSYNNDADQDSWLIIDQASLSVNQELGVELNITIKDSEQQPLNITLEFIDEETGLIVYNKKHARHQGKIRKNKKYKIKIKPEKHPIKNIEFSKITDGPIDKLLDISYNYETDPVYSQEYAVNPLVEEATNFSLTFTATGTEFYKCKDWDFSTQTCYGSWIKLMDTIPGEDYTINLAPGDPGFKEKGGCKCKGIRHVTLKSGYSFVNGSNYNVTAEVFKGSGTTNLIDSEIINFSTLPQNSIDNNLGTDYGNLIIEKINESNIIIKFHNKSKGKLSADDTFRITINGYVLGPDTIHLSCSQPIDIGNIFGDFEVIDIDKKLSGSDCNITTPTLNETCGINVKNAFYYKICDSIYNLTLELIPPINQTTQVDVYDKDNHFIESHTITPANKTFISNVDHPETKFVVVNTSYEEIIHTSCSQPIGEGFVFDEFRIIDWNYEPKAGANVTSKIISKDGTYVKVDKNKWFGVEFEGNLTNDDIISMYVLKKDKSDVYLCEYSEKNCAYPGYGSVYTDPEGWYNITISNLTQETDRFNFDPKVKFDYIVGINYSCLYPANDTTPPIVDLESPANNTVLNNTNVLFAYNAVDNESGIDYCDLIINETVYETNYSIIKGVTQNFTQTLSEGDYEWSVNCTDSAGNKGESETWEITVELPVNDTTAPNVTLISLPNATTDYDGAVSFEYNVTDNSSISSCELIINGTVNQTDYSITKNISQYFNANFGSGTYYWGVNCTDSAGNKGESETWQFSVVLINDTTPPNVTLVSPANNSNYTSDWVTFTYGVTDNESEISNCELIINATVNQTDYSITVNATNTFNQNLQNGFFNWGVNCTDTQGNTGQSEWWVLWVNSTEGNATSCCCNLDVTTTPRIANLGERVLIAADVNVEKEGIPATQSDIREINVTVYRVDNNTQVIIIDNQPMSYINPGLWYYSVDGGFNQTGNYIASAVMVTNQSPSFTKQASYAFTVKDRGAGLNVQGVSPDLINKDELTRLGAEVQFDGKAVDENDLTNTFLDVVKVNGTTQHYNTTTGLNVDDGLLYVDGSFNETGVYYLNWTVTYQEETRSAKEIVIVVDWGDKLSNISVDINQTLLQEIINLINENRQYLLSLLNRMEVMEEFTQEEIFLVTDSVNSMTDIVNYLQEGKITPQEAEEDFALLQARLQKELGSKLLGGAITEADVEPEKSKVVKTLLVVILLLFLLTIIIGGRKVITLREEKPIDVAKLRQGMAKVNEKVKGMKIVDTISYLMQIRRVKLYLAIIVILLSALILMELNPALIGFSVYPEQQISGAFVLAGRTGIRVARDILTLSIITLLLMILGARVKKARAKKEVEKREADERNKSIEHLLKTGTEPKKQLKVQDEPRVKLSKDFDNEKEIKVKTLVSGAKSFITGIKPRQFEPEETMFSRREGFERKYTKADIAMTKTNTLTSEIKQQIVNAGLNDYLGKHAQEQEYIEIPRKHRKQKGHVVKVFRLSKKEDFYPIIECMRENKHLILIDAHGMLSKDPELMKKLAKQLDYVGMVYDTRLAALDEKSFAIIPKFARFEKP